MSIKSMLRKGIVGALTIASFFGAPALGYNIPNVHAEETYEVSTHKKSPDMAAARTYLNGVWVLADSNDQVFKLEFDGRYFNPNSISDLDVVNRSLGEFNFHYNVAGSPIWLDCRMRRNTISPNEVDLFIDLAGDGTFVRFKKIAG